VLKPIDTIKIDAQNMEFSKVRLNKHFVNNGKQLLLIFLSKGKNNVSFNYVAKPKQAMYFIGLRGKDNLQSLDARTRKSTPSGFRVLMM
jgi:aminopeptidase N